MKLENPRHFLGEVCRRHPELRGRRYISDRSCTACTRERTQKRRARLPASTHGLATAATFQGKVCRRHPQLAGLRYRSSERCLLCQREKLAAQRRAAGMKERTQARKKARARGDLHYKSDHPCARGHRGLRLTSSGQCLESARFRYARMKPRQRARLLQRQRERDRRGTRAMRVLKELGLTL
jgi:hypothetical protein